MSKQTRTTSAPLLGNAERMMRMGDRYYVQRLTEQVFLIRECLSTDGKPGPDDRIVRSCEVRYDANQYADSMNEKQRKLDEQSGHWTEHASEER